MTKQIITALALTFASSVALAAEKDTDKPQRPATEATDQKAGAGGQDMVDQGKTPVPTAAKETGADKDKGEATAKPSDKATGQAAESGASGKPGSAQGRNWDAIDKDGNNLISAEEMDGWLKANPGPLAGAAGASGKEADKEKK